MTGGRLFPTYELINEVTKKTILLAKKMNLNRTSNYHFFDMTRGAAGSKLTKKSGNYLGKLRAKNGSRTEYVLLSKNSVSHDELAAVMFDRLSIFEQLKEGSQPRKMIVALPPLDTDDLIKMVGGPPLIVKLLEGTQGKGVVLAETKKAAESVINAFKSINANILVQEFIKEANGKDIRCFVIDGKVVAAIQREALPGEFRANIHLGGTASLIRVTSEEKKIAIKAAKAMDLKVAGVDIIRSSKGPLLLEVNSSPGLEGIEGATNIDVAGKMIKAIEKHFKL
jgi:hypothetical protein